MSGAHEDLDALLADIYDAYYKDLHVDAKRVRRGKAAAPKYIITLTCRRM
jgi:hypothetical protein